MNEHFHNWHKKIILNFIEGKEGLKLLDVGCGYGRLSKPIIEKFPDIDIVGLDLSKHYVAFYEKNTNHPAVIGAIENIPGDLGVFDYIICVTVLMYLDNGQLNKAISNLLFHLKQDGKLILIEPHLSGSLFQTGFGLFSFFRKRQEGDTPVTGGRYFRSREIENRFVQAGGKVLGERRLPITSLVFLPIALIGKLFSDGMVRRTLRLLSLLDDLFSRSKLPSVHVAYLIAKDEKRNRL